jgi:hypothetical protein
MILRSRGSWKSVDEFSALHIDQDPDSQNNPHTDVFLKKIVNHHIVQLPKQSHSKGTSPFRKDI